MWMKWLPWRFLVRKLALSQGISDPVSLMAQLSRFAQPSEVAVPIELIRLGALLQTRGLINSQAIQHNLDWIWPYWVVRQFDPESDSFIPRAFSLTHINLSHRNWTAVGLPGLDLFPIVDPRGLVTPHYDGWSIDSWIIDPSEEDLLPSHMESTRQKLEISEDDLAVVTTSEKRLKRLCSKVSVKKEGDIFFCKIDIKAEAPPGASLAVSLRPANPEGVSFLHKISFSDNTSWHVNDKHAVHLSRAPFKMLYSHYRLGDVYRTDKPVIAPSVKCDVGMATAMAFFPIEKDSAGELTIKVPLTGGARQKSTARKKTRLLPGWPAMLNGTAVLKGARARVKYLYDASIRSVVLHSPDEIYPGPYTYKHFWFRDAAFIVYAMIKIGMNQRARAAIDLFFRKQRLSGLFCSQEGEWDSNGQVLWVVGEYLDITGDEVPEKWIAHIERGANWICSKRVSEESSTPHAGLLPPGFSAEHFGPNDYYYWDDLWAVSGLRAASAVMRRCGKDSAASRFGYQARSLEEAIHKSLNKTLPAGNKIMPSSPYRRPDSASIGPLVAGYPLQLLEASDPLLSDTADFLLKKYTVKGGFYHDMSHSGINPYLTLQLAQVLLRSGDHRFRDLLRSTMDLASPTGQWPEAINPRSLGGCMGDGQHVWASAEWIMMMVNCFVREESERLILASGVNAEWFEKDKQMAFGPVATRFGTLTLKLRHEAGILKAKWDAQWRGTPSEIMLAPLAGETVTVSGNAREAECILKAYRA